MSRRAKPFFHRGWWCTNVGGSAKEAEAAIAALNGMDFGGRTITVNEAQHREEHIRGHREYSGYLDRSWKSGDERKQAVLTTWTRYIPVLRATLQDLERLTSLRQAARQERPSQLA